MELVARAGTVPALCGRFRLLSCTSVAGRGLLAAFRPDGAEIGGERRDGILAAVSRAAEGDGFQGII